MKSSRSLCAAPYALSVGEWSGWASVVLAALGLILTTVRQVRQSSSRRRADQAEQAGRLLDLLLRVGLEGTTQGLKTEQIRSKHEEQVHRLQQVVRLGAADFAYRSLRPGLSWSTIALLAFYAVLFGVATSRLMVGVTGPLSADVVSSVVAGLLFLATAVGSGVAAVVSVYRRWRLNALRKAAGVFVLGPWAETVAIYRQFRALMRRWLERRRLRRS